MNACSFLPNSQTAVPRLISRLGGREGNAMLNEKKRDGRRRKKPFTLIWYGNISCSHTRRGYENKQLGDGRDRRKRRGVAGGEVGRSREMFRVMFFRKRGDRRGWKDGGSRWGGGDERGMKRKGNVGEENLLHPALQLIPSGWEEERAVVRLPAPSAERKVPLICETFRGDRAADRRAGKHKDRWPKTKKTKKKGEAARTNREAGGFRRCYIIWRLTAWQTGEQDTNRTNRNMQTSPHSCGTTCPKTHCCSVCVCRPFCLMSPSVCVCVHNVSRGSPAALLESANNPPEVNGAPDPARSLDLCRHLSRGSVF